MKTPCPICPRYEKIMKDVELRRTDPNRYALMKMYREQYTQHRMTLCER